MVITSAKGGGSMKRCIVLIVLLLMAGCAMTLKDPHPEMNRTFRVGIDTPGEYPY
jgi:hypothetical protein